MTRRRRLPRPGRAIADVATWVAVLVFISPIMAMVATAFMTEEQAGRGPALAFVPTLDRFVEVFDRGMGAYLANSAMASVGSTAIVLLLAVPAAYALSIRPVRSARDVLVFFLSTRFLPLAAGVLPIYLVLQALGALDDVSALTLLYVGMNLPLAVWMLRSFLDEVPMEVIEAARVDGAGLRVEMLRVVVPMIAPGIAAVALLCCIFAWNEYFLANLLTATVARTTPPFLTSFVDGRGQFIAVLSAAATIAVLPVVVAGWIAQKRLVRGLAMGAIK